MKACERRQHLVRVCQVLIRVSAAARRAAAVFLKCARHHLCVSLMNNPIDQTLADRFFQLSAEHYRNPSENGEQRF